MNQRESNLLGSTNDAKKAADSLTRKKPDLLGNETLNYVGNTIDDVNGFLEKGKNEEGVYLFLCSSCGSESKSADCCSSCGLYLAKPEYCPPHKTKISYFPDIEEGENKSDEQSSTLQKDFMSSYQYRAGDLVIKNKNFSFIVYPDGNLDNPISVSGAFNLRTQKFFNGVRTVDVPEADITINKGPTDDNLQKLIRRLVLKNQK